MAARDLDISCTYSKTYARYIVIMLSLRYFTLIILLVDLDVANTSGTKRSRYSANVSNNYQMVFSAVGSKLGTDGERFRLPISSTPMTI